MARGEAPKYSGAHANLSEEEKETFRAEGRKPSIRIRVPEDYTYEFDDIVRGKIAFESSDFGVWVIFKQDGTPTYNFVVVIDDYLIKISHVLRGEEYISITTRKLMVYYALGWAVSIF